MRKRTLDRTDGIAVLLRLNFDSGECLAFALGQRVLIHGAAGGVATALLQLGGLVGDRR